MFRLQRFVYYETWLIRHLIARFANATVCERHDINLLTLSELELSLNWRLVFTDDLVPEGNSTL